MAFLLPREPMAHRGIREYDAKQLRATATDWSYTSILITEDSQIETLTTDLESLTPWGLWIVKPDMLFGKRGKYGLVWVKLTAAEVTDRIRAKRAQDTTIGAQQDKLDVFLVEPFVPHEVEWYVAIHAERDGDKISFGEVGGMEIEHNRDQVRDLTIWVDDQPTAEQLQQLCGSSHADDLAQFLTDLLNFTRSHGFASLEINPATRDESGQIVCLDMVAKVDTCEARRQKSHRQDVAWVKPFGTRVHPLEETIDEVDSKTGASLKFTMLNPTGKIGLLLGGGGASVVTMDKLAAMGLLEHVINYGELSGNPSYDDNKIYIQGLLDVMYTNQHDQQYLCLIGGIANFTRIDVLCQAFVDVLSANVNKLTSHNIHILVRRGGVRDTEWLAMVRNFCDQHAIPCSIADGDVYITDSIEQVTF